VSLLFGPDNRPLGAPEPKHQMIEDVKSFSFKLNLKNPDGSPAYEDANFFQSRKYRCRQDQQEEAAREAFEWCASEVTRDIKEFLDRRTQKQQLKKTAQRSEAA